MCLRGLARAVARRGWGGVHFRSCSPSSRSLLEHSLSEARCLERFGGRGASSLEVAIALLGRFDHDPTTDGSIGTEERQTDRQKDQLEAIGRYGARRDAGEEAGGGLFKTQRCGCRESWRGRCRGGEVPRRARAADGDSYTRWRGR